MVERSLRARRGRAPASRESAEELRLLLAGASELPRRPNAGSKPPDAVDERSPDRHAGAERHAACRFFAAMNWRLPVSRLAERSPEVGRRWSSHAGQGCSHIGSHRAARVVRSFDRRASGRHEASTQSLSTRTSSSVKTMMEASVAARPGIEGNRLALTRLEEVAERVREADLTRDVTTCRVRRRNGVVVDDDQRPPRSAGVLAAREAVQRVREQAPRGCACKSAPTRSPRRGRQTAAPVRNGWVESVARFRFASVLPCLFGRAWRRSIGGRWLAFRSWRACRTMKHQARPPPGYSR